MCITQPSTRYTQVTNGDKNTNSLTHDVPDICGKSRCQSDNMVKHQTKVGVVTYNVNINRRMQLEHHGSRWIIINLGKKLRSGRHAHTHAHSHTPGTLPVSPLSLPCKH